MQPSRARPRPRDARLAVPRDGGEHHGRERAAPIAARPRRRGRRSGLRRHRPVCPAAGAPAGDGVDGRDDPVGERRASFRRARHDRGDPDVRGEHEREDAQIRELDREVVADDAGQRSPRGNSATCDSPYPVSAAPRRHRTGRQRNGRRAEAALRRGRACRHRCCFPCNSGAPAVISRARGALLLSCTQASVAEFGRPTPAPDEQQARAERAGEVV